MLCVDFAPDGFQLATASDDQTVHIWDLRQRKRIYTIPAHGGLISRCKYVVHSMGLCGGHCGRRDTMHAHAQP